MIKRVSPMAWRHINLYGIYEFHRENISINIEEIIEALGQKPIQNQLLPDEENSI